MTNNITSSNVTPEIARFILWNKGNVSWKLDVNQQVLRNVYVSSKEKIVVWNCARGSGKSYALCVIAIEECLKNPKALVKYCCAKQKEARQIIQPIFRDILEDCPPELRPTFIVAEGAYKFPNGAQIQLSGLDNGRAESLRGGSSVLCIVDEAGAKSLKDLTYIIRSILMPAVTRKKEINGKIILASTPPLSRAHPFVYYLRRAEIRGASVTRDVYTNPRMTADMIKQIIEESGGEDSVGFQREYLCHIITDSNEAVVPEFTEALQKKIVKEWPRPIFFDAYTAMDLGMTDLTVVLFAYYDFKNTKLIIEDEFVTNGQKFTTKSLAEGIKQKEDAIFSDPFTRELKPPYKRVSDNNLIVINDLYVLHGLMFLPTRKDDADAALNNMKIMLNAEQIIINPRCVTLIRHLRDATWNKSRKSYDRSPDNGHFDAVDSLKYLVRNIDLNKNPYPVGYGVHRGDDYFQFNKPSLTKYDALARSMCNIKK